jgi:hypothetical protein
MKVPFMVGVPKKEEKDFIFKTIFYKLHLHETNLNEKN